MFTNLAGKKSSKVKNKVEMDKVKAFAQSIGDVSPIFVDASYGEKTLYKKNIAPLTFPQTFLYGDIIGLNLPESGLIHGEQNYYYERPLVLDEEVFCYSEVKEVYEKPGKNGIMTFLKIVNKGEDIDRKLIFSVEQVVIITEEVKKGMMK